MSPSHLRWRLVTTASCLLVAVITMVNAFDPYGLFTVRYSFTDVEKSNNREKWEGEPQIAQQQKVTLLKDNNIETGGDGEYFYFRGQLLASPLSEDGSWQNIIHLTAIHARYFLGTLYGVLSLFLVAYVIEDAVLLLTYKEKVPAG